jgi:prephenate dehydrogenase
MHVSTLGIIGVGLLGGSIALAARRRGLADRVVGHDQSPDVLAQALQSGLLDEAHDLPAAVVAAAELTVFCTPVDCIAPQALALAASCHQGAVLTDVGSTKAAILRELDGRLPAGVVFVGSHPLAGSEKNGPAHASATLLEGRLVVVTPAADTPAQALGLVCSFWEALGARVQTMSADDHDRALALTSHLPHLVSSALAGILPQPLRELTASGFRDTTRLAAGQPALWSAIFEANQEPLLAALDRFEERLALFRAALGAADRQALEALLEEGKRIRDGLGR